MYVLIFHNLVWVNLYFCPTVGRETGHSSERVKEKVMTAGRIIAMEWNGFVFLAKLFGFSVGVEESFWY